MPATTYDISDITESLVTSLTNANTSSPLWKVNGGTIPKFDVNITSSSPDSVRLNHPGDCQLNLYLLHIGQSPFMRNTPIFGTGAMRPTQQPLALDLSYLLTAFAGDNADREQQAMSIALRCLYEEPIATVSGQYLTITLGTDTLDEMSRLWQSFTVAYRLSALFRVAVVLITPSQPPDTASPPPKIIDIAVAPAVAALTTTPQLFDLSRQVTTSFPAGATDPTQVVTTAAPAAAVAGAQLRIGGQGLSNPAVTDVFLDTLDASTSWTVTAWRANASLDSELTLNLPSSYAIAPALAVPASLPPPGVYLLSVGGAAPVSRSRSIPLAIAPLIAGVADPPILPGAGGIYNIAGAGFVPGATQIFVGATPLVQLMSPPTASSGAYNVSADGTAIQFALPPGQPPGLASVRVRVEGIDAPPAWQVLAP